MKKIHPLLLIFICISVISCGGPRLNRAYEKPTELPVLMQEQGAHVNLNLLKILIRNSKDSWVKDAKWDEYLIQIEPLSHQETKIISVSLIDTFGDVVSTVDTRKGLIKASKALKSKYKKAGYKVKWGEGSTHVDAISVSSAVGVGVAAGSVTTTGSIGTLTSAGVGVAVAVPALLITGVVKIVNNTKVNNRIQLRQAKFPLDVTNQNQVIDVFFPAVPSPKTVVVKYTLENEEHTISLDISEMMNGVHIRKKKTK